MKPRRHSHCPAPWQFFIAAYLGTVDSAELGDDYRIITLTLPGHGLTGPHPNDDYSALMNFTPRSIVKESLLQTVSVKSTITEEMVDLYWELVRYPGNRRAANFRATTDAELQMESEAKNITAPTLIIWGQEDALIYVSAATSFDERLPNSEVIIYEGIGHLPMEEAPIRTAKDIDGFLERIRMGE